MKVLALCWLACGCDDGFMFAVRVPTGNATVSATADGQELEARAGSAGFEQLSLEVRDGSVVFTQLSPDYETALRRHPVKLELVLHGTTYTTHAYPDNCRGRTIAINDIAEDFLELSLPPAPDTELRPESAACVTAGGQVIRVVF